MSKAQNRNMGSSKRMEGNTTPLKTHKNIIEDLVESEGMNPQLLTSEE
jgi:hypothetical protein